MCYREYFKPLINEVIYNTFFFAIHKAGHKSVVSATQYLGFLNDTLP